MSKIKKLGWILLAVLGISLTGGFIFVNSLTPTYQGELELPGLKEEVKVYYDGYGIPHIYAQYQKDAFKALGYVHAQDRLWQMELLRRIGNGRLSEVFGEVTIETDKFFLALGIDEASAKTVAQLDMDSEAVKLSQAYLEGINQFIAQGPTPLEFYLTGLEKTDFTLQDIQNILGYMAFSFAQAHKTDPLLTNIKDSLGMDYLEDLEVDVDPNTTLIYNYGLNGTDTTQLALFDKVNNTLEMLHIPLFEGSNSWVIAPGKTKNGKVIFANDPHIGFAQPSVWFEAHVVAPDYERYGYHLAGVPFPILAHDRNLAYGMTMFGNDDVDFYYEETHPTDPAQYKTNDGWETYKTKDYTIKVKGAEEVPFTVTKTERGPILNGIMEGIRKGNPPVSMWWAYIQNKNELVYALYEMSTADSMEDIQEALPQIHAPGLNIMYGDAKGNIAWWATAKLYEIPDSVHTKFIQTSIKAFPSERKYLDFKENPQAVNPPWNYVYSANNQPDSIVGRLYPGYYLENRAKRIVDLLESKNDWDKESVSKMLLDVVSPINPKIVEDLSKNLHIDSLGSGQLKVLDQLNLWEGDYPLESIEATVFHRWIYFFLKNTFEDELGRPMFNRLLKTNLSKRLIAPMAKKRQSIWWDNVHTEKVEDKQAIVQKSFLEAYASLEDDLGEDISGWTWGKVHTLEHNHPIGQAGGLLRSFFNVGPFPIHGTRGVINSLGFGYSDDLFYKVSSGPSTRRVIDFSDIGNSMGILPTGQSGNPFSPHYGDQAQMYVQGKFRKMMMNKEEIEATSESLLTFRPTQE